MLQQKEKWYFQKTLDFMRKKTFFKWKQQRFLMKKVFVFVIFNLKNNNLFVTWVQKQHFYESISKLGVFMTKKLIF